MKQLMGALALGIALTCTSAFALDRPNILVILVDDLGYDAPSIAPGGPPISTPSIDALARRGVRARNGYAVAAVCAPARAGLMTGRYPHRFGLENNQPAGERRGVPTTEPLLSERLKAEGYQTAVIGKWHIGGLLQLRPLARGFDYFYGFLPSATDYFEPFNLMRNSTPISGDDVVYLTDTFADEAINFLRGTNADSPWFLYLAFNAVHVPLQAKPQLLARVSHIPAGQERTYAAMVLGADDAIGRVMAEITRLGQANNTFIWFQSDNGGAPWKGASNFPLRGGKGSLYEGGVRVPTYISWPDQIPAGRVMTGLMTGLDLVPTALSAAQAPAASGLDGQDLLPSLRSASVPIPTRPLVWRLNTTCAPLRPELLAVRQGRWKLVVNDGVEQVFDLLTDEGETQPVNYPPALNSLRNIAANWQAQMPDPLWCDIE